MITLIVAASDNNVIGKDNDLLWHLPNDFKRFKSLTSGHCIIMGRKTFESLPGILPKRTHIIITRQPNYKIEGCIIVGSLEAAIEEALKIDDNPFVIGGGQIYKQALQIADKIELTRVHVTIEGDTYFPDIDLTNWVLTFSESHSEDEKHKFAYTFESYHSKKNT